MAINKVVYGADTLLDLTEDTVTAEDVLNSKSFHTSDGVKRTGNASYPVTDVQVNGTSVMDGTVAKVEQPTAEEQTAVDEFETINGGLLSSLKVSLTPIQDLHGYDHPWVGGAGKNSFVSATAKTEEQNNVKIWTDGDGIYHIDGTPTATTSISFPLKQGFTIPPSSTHHFYLGNDFNNVGAAFDLWNGSTRVDYWTCTPANRDSDSYSAMANKYIDGVRITVPSGVSLSNVSIAPMLLLDTETDTSYAPWDNICPISGHTEVKVGDDGKNLLPNNITTVTAYGVTYETQEDGSIEGNGTSTGWANANLVNDLLLKAGTYILSGTTVAGAYITVVPLPDTGANYSAIGPNGTIQITFDNDTHVLVRVSARAGTVLSNAKYYPMLRLASDTDPTFVPYNGYQITVNLGGTYYSGILDVVTGVFTPDTASVVFDGSDDENWAIVLSDPSVYFFIHVPTMTAKDWKYVLSEAFKDVYKETDARNNDCSIWSRYQQIHIHAPSFIVPSGVSNEGLAEFKAWLSNNPQKVVYELATPTPIQLSPTMVKALVGENHLSAPLEGQEITESKYKQMFTFDDVIAYIQSLS